MSATQDKISAQEFADSIVGERFRQPLKTLEEAITSNGWDFVDHPSCCEEPVDIQSFIGAPYFVQCKKCGKFAVDVFGPTFGNSWVRCVDSEKVDTSVDNHWISGTEPIEDIHL